MQQSSASSTSAIELIIAFAASPAVFSLLRRRGSHHHHEPPSCCRCCTRRCCRRRRRCDRPRRCRPVPAADAEHHYPDRRCQVQAPDLHQQRMPPYPAVDEDGNTSGGLKPTGSQSAGCKGSGYGSQIYGRAVEYEGVYAFMYSWYMPKDETLSGLGHRHDWENCVVWLDSLDNPSIVALSASYHSTYLYYYPPDSDYLDGNSAKIEYSTSWVILDHSLSATSTAGETQDLIMWDQLTDAARTALEDTDFGSANVPFKEANFATKVAKAYYA